MRHLPKILKKYTDPFYGSSRGLFPSLLVCSRELRLSDPWPPDQWGSTAEATTPAPGEKLKKKILPLIKGAGVGRGEGEIPGTHFSF